MKKYGEIPVNDGNGLLDNEGMCDSILSDLNGLLKHLIDGQFVIACAVVSGMVQKLINLKAGIKNDMEAMKNKVEELKKMNDSLVEQMTGLPVEKDGADNGSN